MNNKYMKVIKYNKYWKNLDVCWLSINKHGIEKRSVINNL
jgi:hypothetical protein